MVHVRRTFFDVHQAYKGAAAKEVLARTTAVAAFARKRPPRQPFPEHLPRERVVVPAPASCPYCGSDKLCKLGETITETLEVIRIARPAPNGPTPTQKFHTRVETDAWEGFHSANEKAPEPLGSGAFHPVPDNGRSDRIRTCDPQTPSLMRYQAALRSVAGTGVGRDYSGAGRRTQRVPATFFALVDDFPLNPACQPAAPAKRAVPR